jgi:hypothetical protein
MTAEGSATAVYTTYAKVIAELAGNLPPSLTEAVINAIIADQSRVLDGRLTRHSDFEDIAGTPATPPSIEILCRYMVVWACFGRVAQSNRTEPGSLPRFYFDWVEAKVAALNDGTDSIPPQAMTGETLTFGTGVQGALQTDESLLTKKNIIPETLEVTTPSASTKYLEDFEVYYSVAHRSWIYRALSSLGKAATAVSYEYSHLIVREFEAMGIRTGRLTRA